MDHVPVETPGPERKVDGRRARHDAHRDELVRKAIDYVFDSGLSDLSVRPLAAALGISHRTLLYHFGSKEALISRVLHELRQRERLAFLVDAHDLGSDPAGLLRRLWSHFSTREHESFFRFFFEVWGTALQHPERFEEFLDGVVEGWLEVIEGSLRASGCPTPTAQSLATMTVAGVRGLLLDQLTTGDRNRVDQAFELLVEFVASQCRLVNAGVSDR